MDNNIIAFLRVSGPDNRGRMISDIWNYSHEELERTHDYIQWLFPLFERSKYQPDSPMLTPDIAAEIAADETCKASLNHSVLIMRSFYGLNSHWANIHDHNLLRITRILKSSALLLGNISSKEFYEFIMTRCDKLEFKPLDTTIEYWNEATKSNTAEYRIISSNQSFQRGTR